MKWFHRLIHRNKRLFSIEQFYSVIDGQASLFPKLNPHPGLDRLKLSLEDFREYPQMRDVLFVVDSWENGGPVSNCVVTVGQRVTPEETEEFASDFGLLSYIDSEDKYKLHPKNGEVIGVIYEGNP